MLSLWILLVGIAQVLGDDLYSLSAKDWQGNNVPLDQFRGKVNRTVLARHTGLVAFLCFQVSLIVNVSLLRTQKG